jgi:hypothetical protein
VSGGGGADGFQVFVDELTALRRSVEHLARTSLDKDEARDLNQGIYDGLNRMIATGETLERALADQMDVWLRETATGAVRAAERAVEGVKADLDAERQEYARTLSEARQEARRARLRSWPILAALFATGALLGVLAAMGLQGRDDAAAFGRFPGVYCDSAGGERLTTNAGRRACVFWLDGPTGG